MEKSEKTKSQEKKSSCSIDSCCIIATDCDAPDCSFKSPGVAKAFELFGWLFALAGVILLILTLINRDTLLVIPASSIFIGGMVYLAVAAIVRAVAETAWNTRELVRLKEAELHHTGTAE